MIKTNKPWICLPPGTVFSLAVRQSHSFAQTKIFINHVGLFCIFPVFAENILTPSKSIIIFALLINEHIYLLFENIDWHWTACVFNLLIVWMTWQKAIFSFTKSNISFKLDLCESNNVLLFLEYARRIHV